MQEKQLLINEIENVFSDAEKPNDELILDSLIYEEQKNYRKNSTVQRVYFSKLWKEVELEEIPFSHPYQLSPIGAAYFCPIILIHSINNETQGEVWWFFDTYIFDIEPDGNLNPDYSKERADFKSYLTFDQKRVIAKFLQYKHKLFLERHPEFDDSEEFGKALAGSWRDFI